jgi:selenide,water dikinase
MDATSPPPLVSDLVLIGGGHAHVHVLKMCGMPPIKEQLQQNGIRVTLISDTVLTPYSGMLPGYISGHYTWEEIHLDLNKLCQFGGVRFVNTSATQITQSKDGEPGLIYCSDGRPPLRYDALSIDIGINPAGLPSKNPKEIVGEGLVTAVKPISGFAAKYDQVRKRLERDCKKYTKENPFLLAVVGGGAGMLHHRFHSDTCAVKT